MKNSIFERLSKKIDRRTATIGVIGMGYVGLPLVIEFAKAGYPVLGFDIDEKKTEAINAGHGYIQHIPSAAVQEVTNRKNCRATTNFADLKKADCVIICVPTPLTKHREPDMTHVKAITDAIAKRIHKGQLIILESTTYPGTTREVVQPPLEASGLKAGRDFFLAYSPEREDPGNPKYSTQSITKVVGGLTPLCETLACALYDTIVTGTVSVSSPDVAEATKLLENIFRSVNIALVNEMKVVFDKMGIDVWEAIQAASTKPFGYMPFYPGPGLGGHCIPIDPFYLTWRAREFNVSTRFIELAGEVNTAMPEYVIDRLAEALNDDCKSIKKSRILILGMAYKSDVDDIRESPTLRLIELLGQRSAKVEYHDPFIPKYGLKLASVKLTPAKCRSVDAVLIATAHKDVDYKMVGQHAQLILDTRNVMGKLKRVKSRVVKA